MTATCTSVQGLALESALKRAGVRERTSQRTHYGILVRYSCTVYGRMSEAIAFHPRNVSVTVLEFPMILQDYMY